MRRFLLVIVMICFGNSIYSQSVSKNNWWKDNVSIHGYIKYLNTSSFKDLNNVANDNLIHNRINLKAFINENLTFDLQLRNRLFWGNSLQYPYFKNFIDPKNHIDLSTFLIDKPALLLHSKIDRVSLTYYYKNWEFKLGRQRINWGKAWAWNSNNLFNTYNVLDFDYEERPGTDAVSVLYNYGNASLAQVVYSYGKDWEHSIFAVRNQFKIKTYDIQVIAASYLTDYALGVGWEGYIGNVGFKGESTTFMPKKNKSNQKTVVLSTISFDYFFKDGLMMTASILHNSGGSDKTAGILSIYNLFAELPNARNIMPNRLSYFVQSNYQINPASSASLGTMYLQGANVLGIIPSYSYSIKQNWDLDFFGQIFFSEANSNFGNQYNSLSMRLRWSY